jgi:phosphopantetheinyl transferase (holo-ACP synthase)
MKIAGLHVLTESDLTRMVQDGAARLAEQRASQILARWAGNEACLKAAFAARNRLSAEHVFMADGLLEKESRGVQAFAEAMGKERKETA